MTCPWDNHVERSLNYKEEKYSPSVADLDNDFRVFHYSVEVSVRGQVTKDNRACLNSFTVSGRNKIGRELSPLALI